MAFKKMTVTMTTFFLTFCSQNGCYKSSLTHLKFTKSHLQRSRFKKVFPRGKPPDPCFWGGRFAAGEGWGGRGKGRDGREGEWKGEGMWRGPESGLPGARAGSRRACVGLTVVWYAININENMHVAAKNFYTTDRTVQWLRPLILDKIWSKKTRR